MTIPAAFLDDLRARVPVSEIIGRRVRLSKAGREWKGLSPFNKERSPSFFVNDEKRFWHDFSSGKHGDIFAFVMEMEGRTFPQAVEEIAAIAGATLPADQTPPIATVPAPARSARSEAAEQEIIERRRKALRLWMRSRQPVETIVETYLHARGYHGPIPATVRYLPANGAYAPALIAAYGIATERQETGPGVLSIADKELCGVHLINLLPDGTDRLRDDGAKITIGKGIVAPIVLAPPNDGLGLCIAEGIEDALNAHQATGLGAWAAGGAGRLPMLADAIPRYIESVTILVDDNEAGRVNSDELAARAHARGFEVLMSPIGSP
jgi:hypothetical protein